MKPWKVEEKRQLNKYLAIPRKWGAGWLVLRRHERVRAVEQQGLRPVYADGSYVVFRL